MMRIVLLSIVVGWVAASAVAQGTVNFANIGVGLSAPVFDIDGVTRLSGDAFLSQLYVGATATESSLTAVPGPAPLLSGANAGFYMGGTRTLSSFPPGSKPFCQVRTWASAGGNSYDEALAAGKYAIKSAVFQIGMPLGNPNADPPTPPATLLGLTSYSYVSEPSTIALGILGTAALFLLRRR